MNAGTFDDRFNGLSRLYGVQYADRVKAARVAVIGIGGVGSWTVEALARSGVGHLTLMDPDEVCINNSNRQLHTMSNTIGRGKASVMAERSRLINPDIEVEIESDFLTPDNTDQLLNRGYDVIIDAADSVRTKCHLVAVCRERQQPLVEVGGAGGVRDPNRIMVLDLGLTYNDRMLFQVRRRLRREYGFPRIKESYGIPCVFSAEVAFTADGQSEKDIMKGRLDCSSGWGTAAFITGTMGMYAAGVAINMLCDQQQKSPAD